MRAAIHHKLKRRSLRQMRGPFTNTQRKGVVTTDLSPQPRQLYERWIPLNQTHRN